MTIGNTSLVFNDLLINKLDIAYICVGHDMLVKNVSDNIQEFGFDAVSVGSDITDYMDFMVGIDTRSELQLPFVVNSIGDPISIRIIPDQDTAIVVISDAEQLYQHRETLQQHANENELLLNQQKKLMKQLDEAVRLQTSFLSGVSHEFRTPLSSIIGYTNLLSRDIEKIKQNIPGAENYLSAVRRSSSHLLSLVENLLDHGKLDSDELVVNPKTTNLSELFEDVSILLDPLTATKNIALNVVTDIPNNAIALVDDSRLRQCMINIIGNAIKFTDVGSVKVSASWQDDILSVKVIDTGLGISKENLNKIMLPFWQAPDTGKAGTGLGLTITKRIIDLMGGALKIDSVLGTGSTVEFSLPAPQIEASQARIDSIVHNPDKQLSLLLVEDDDDIADLVMLLLEEKGTSVVRVENGALAIEMAERSTFDLILMDIHMPIMNGYDAIKKIRQAGNETPIIVMSASPLETEQEKVEQLGCNGYLVKPVDIDDIFRIANDVVV
ncbi:MAG: response regulator [Acidiferrobacterales bacterium]|nr:response regulator [Acidiferrobacterales bacterium]